MQKDTFYLWYLLHCFADEVHRIISSLSSPTTDPISYLLSQAAF